MKRNHAGMSGTAGALALIAILLVAAFVVSYYVLPNLRETGTTQSSSTTQETSTNSTSSGTTATSTQRTDGQVRDPSFANGVANVTFPTDYSKLAAYQLSIINSDRAKFKLSPVTLSPIQSGQQHADSMLYFGYFNHWDAQGYKPYMRYTLMNGMGGMEENVAYEYTDSPYYLNTDLVKTALTGLEYQMIYNDSSCCQNGHRANILDPLHNRVSLGIEYGPDHVYLVQDFENYYINFSQPVLSKGELVRLVGNASTSLRDSQVLIFYDSYPTLLNKSQLSSAQYAGAYDQGSFAGGVVEPCTLTCNSYSPHVTVTAAVWTVTSRGLDIQFRMTDFIRKYGTGVYTIYLERSASQNPEILFDMSVFVNSSTPSS